METEAMKALREQEMHLRSEYRRLYQKEIEDFQKNPKNLALVGKYYKYNKSYFKILDVPQVDWRRRDFSYNEYQFPAFEVRLSETDWEIEPDSSLFVRDGVPSGRDSAYNFNGRIPPVEEVTEKEFNDAIKTFFAKYDIEGVF